MNKDWDENALSQLRIHELRDLARKIGVKCPTALKKEDIINNVIQILNGEAEPYKATNKKGRPTKSGKQLDTIMDLFLPDENSLVADLSPKEDADFEFCVNAPQIEYNAEDNEKVCGLFELIKNNYGVIRVNNFVCSNNDVFVHELFVVNNNLKSGDFVEAYVKTVMPNKPRTVTKIISVNKNIVKGNKNASVNVYNEKTLLAGDSLLVLNSGLNTSEQAANLFNEINDGVKMFVSAYEKNKLESKNDNQIYAYVNQFAGFNDIYCCYNMAFNRANVLSENTSVTMVVNQISAYFRAVETFFSGKVDSEIKLSSLTKEEILNKLKIAKQNGVKVVIVDTLKQEPKIKDFLEFELTKVVDDVVFI